MEFVLLMICGVTLGYILYLPFRKKLVVERIAKMKDEDEKSSQID
jgi:hypothetical protein